jgi:hypothetical protein
MEGHESVVDVATKLQIKVGQSVLLVAAPAAFTPLDRPVATTAQGADAVLGFVTRRREVGAQRAVIAAATADRLAWIAYPKAGQLGTDLSRDTLREEFERLGLATVRQVALDDVWSALRLRPA